MVWQISLFISLNLLKQSDSFVPIPGLCFQLMCSSEIAHIAGEMTQDGGKIHN